VRILVTGATGFVGSNVVEAAAMRGHEVVGTGRSGGDGAPACDLLDREAAFALVGDASPEAIVHCAILNDLAAIYADRQLAWESYVGTTRAMADAANAVRARLILVSTDWVFDGTQGPAAEDEPPNPVNYYGVLKAMSEVVALERARAGAVARLAAVSGIHGARPAAPRRQDPGFGYLAASIVDRLERGEPFTLWTGHGINMVATPSLASASAEMILRVAELRLHGVFHCCGGESVGRLAFARAVAETFELDPDLIRTGPPEPSALPPAPIPYDTRLDGSRTAHALGYELPSLRELLARFRRERESVITKVARWEL
jgi:dTDP-4-dehydrorhamnose reductase